MSNCWLKLGLAGLILLGSCAPKEEPPKTSASASLTPQTSPTPHQKPSASPKPTLSAKPAQASPLAIPQKIKKTPTHPREKPQVKRPPQQAHTGVIIDVRHLPVQRSHTAEIYGADGKKILFPIAVNYDYLMDKGLVAYTTSLAAAKKHARSGRFPLVLKGHKAHLPGSVVLNAQDSQKLGALKSILGRYRVVFVVRP